MTTVEAPWYITEKGEKARRARRDALRAERFRREDEVFDAMARGANWQRIADQVGMDRRNVPVLIQSVLERRRDELTPTQEQARAIYVARMQTMVQILMDRFGMPNTDADGNPVAVDTRAGELLLKVLDKLAAVQGGHVPMAQPVEINLNVRDLSDADHLRAKVLADLANVAAKATIIEGELAHAGTDLAQLTTGGSLDDTPPPPAIGER